jgi:hypothetical protein
MSTSSHNKFIIANISTKCDLCEHPILPGDEMFPHHLDLSLLKYRWAHFKCCDPLQLRPLCKHFVKLNRCSLGETCFFRHDSDPALIPKPRRLIKEGRVFAFRRFLLDNFTNHSSVIDVAGGKGELSFELMNLNGWKSTVFDPRPNLDFSDCLKKLAKNLYTRNRNWKHYSPTVLTEPVFPEHVRVLWDEDLYNILLSRGGTRTETAHNSLWKKLRKDADKMIYFDHPDKITSIEVEHETDTDEASEESEDKLDSVLDLIEQADLIVGMHPDKAAEFIVDYCLRVGKSFAVVPCCVFPNSFPHRRLEGKEVRECDDFVEYLKRKDDRLKMAELEFEGRNKCVYWNSKSQDKELTQATVAMPKWIAVVAKHDEEEESNVVVL